MERDSEIRAAVGAVVKRERTARGLTVKALAKLADMDWSMLYAIERGDSLSAPAQLERIAKELGLTLPELYVRALPRRGRKTAPRRLSARLVRRAAPPQHDSKTTE